MEQHKHIQENIEPIVSKYIGLLFGPILMATVFAIAVQYTDHPTLLEVAAHASLIVYLLAAIYNHHDHFNWNIVALLGAIAGATVGFLTALFRLMTAFNVIAVFSIFTDTAFAAIIDAIAAAFFYLILTILLQKKGGDAHGNSKTN